MSKRLDLQQSIYDEIKGYTTVYNADAVPDDPSNPYAVYQIASGVNGLFDDSANRQYLLDIDIFYRNTTKDIDVLENIADDIENGLENKSVIEDGFCYDFITPVLSNNIPTTDENMFRRSMTWTIKYMESEIT